MSTQSETDKMLDSLQQWGGASRMGAFESIMWRAEADPRLRSTTTSLFILDREPDWERLYSGHEWLAQAAPRFRQRVVDSALGVGTPLWVEDMNFDLDDHLRRARLPAPGSERQLLDVAQTLAMEPFDRTRSPWEAVLIEGLEGNRAAYLLKLHHASSDGLGIMQLITQMLSRSRQTRGPKPAVPQPTAIADGSMTTPPPSLTNRLSDALNAASRWLRTGDSYERAQRYARSAAHVLGAKPVPGSPLFRRRSLDWRFDIIELALSDLKIAAKALDASLNDVFMAGLVGGFRRYHEVMGVPLAHMPIGFPISVRKEGDAPGGNKFVGSQYAAPVGLVDPIARVRHVQDFVREMRAEPALDAMLRVMPVMAQLPTIAMTTITSSLTAAQDAQVSNIPGIAEDLFLAGAQVTHFWPFAPVPGCGMMIAMITHNGRCCIGINSDRAAVTDPELLTDCLREGLEEMIVLGRSRSNQPADARTTGANK